MELYNFQVKSYRPMLFNPPHKIERLLELQRYVAGFGVANRGCCGIGRNGGQITCLPFQMPCLDRNMYIFWDAFHPTAAVNILFGRNAFNGNQNMVYPINIEQLAKL